MTDGNDFIVTVDDIRETGRCVRGLKNWFQSVGLGKEFPAFLREGILASKLLATGDGEAKKVVEYLRNRNG